MTKDEADRLVNMARTVREQGSVAKIKALMEYVDHLNRYNISRVARAHRQRNNK